MSFLDTCPDEILKQICIHVDAATFVILLDMEEFLRLSARMIENIYHERTRLDYPKYAHLKEKYKMKWTILYQELNYITNIIEFHAVHIFMREAIETDNAFHLNVFHIRLPDVLYQLMHSQRISLFHMDCPNIFKFLLEIFPDVLPQEHEIDRFALKGKFECFKLYADLDPPLLPSYNISNNITDQKILDYLRLKR